MEPIAVIDPRMPEIIVKNLQKSGFKTIEAPLSDLLETPLSGHPDLQMFLHNKNLFVHPEIDLLFLKKVENYVNIIHCSSRLTKSYPGDIPYNIACIGDIALHRKDSTDLTIRDYFLKNSIKIINTKQGYSKCSTLIVDDHSIITADKSIHMAADSAGIDSLLITQGYIDLPGYNYGFIGGASGRYLDTIFLTGSIDHHPDCKNIIKFIETRGLKLKIHSDQKIFDSGSIFFI